MNCSIKTSNTIKHPFSLSNPQARNAFYYLPKIEARGGVSSSHHTDEEGSGEFSRPLP